MEAGAVVAIAIAVASSMVGFLLRERVKTNEQRIADLEELLREVMDLLDNAGTK